MPLRYQVEIHVHTIGREGYAIRTDELHVYAGDEYDEVSDFLAAMVAQDFIDEEVCEETLRGMRGGTGEETPPSAGQFYAD